VSEEAEQAAGPLAPSQDPFKGVAFAATVPPGSAPMKWREAETGVTLCKRGVNHAEAFEDAAYPIESALVPGEEAGWQAAQPGEQTIRLIFDRPQRLSRVWLLFIEPDTARTQEFVLRWSPDGGRTFREILRQQWNFGPPETVREAEDYRVELSGGTMLELAILPDKSGGDARASLTQWRLAG